VEQWLRIKRSRRKEREGVIRERRQVFRCVPATVSTTRMRRDM
jgi:hypothetical protein